MKKFELIKIINEKPYLKHNLSKDMHGIVLEKLGETLNVLFFNPKNIGDFVVVKNIRQTDINVEKEQLPEEMKRELETNIDKILKKAKSKIEPVKIKEYEMVELLVENEKYTKFGIHKDDTGCVMNANAVQDYIEVDFSGIDKNGEYYGDCISVKIDDLKVIK